MYTYIFIYIDTYMHMYKNIYICLKSEPVKKLQYRKAPHNKATTKLYANI